MEFSAFMLSLGSRSRRWSPLPHFTALRAVAEWSLGDARDMPIEVEPGCVEGCVGSWDACACDIGLGRVVWHCSRASRDVVPYV